MSDPTADEARRTVNALYEALERTEAALDAAHNGTSPAASLSAVLTGNRHAKLLANAHFEETRNV